MAGQDTYAVEPWVRDDGKKYMTVTKTHQRAAGSTKPPRISRMAVPVEDWTEFQKTVAAAKVK